MKKVDYSNRKYRILEILQTKFTADKNRELRKELPEILHISQRTFLNWLYMHKDNTTEISYRNLYIIGKVLNTSVEDLLNFDITFKLVKPNKQD